MSSIIWVFPILIVLNFVVNNFLSLWESEMTIFFHFVETAKVQLWTDL